MKEETLRRIRKIKNKLADGLSTSRYIKMSNINTTEYDVLIQKPYYI